MSLKFVPKLRIIHIPTLVQTLMVSLLTHICVTRPQWVNHTGTHWWYIDTDSNNTTKPLPSSHRVSLSSQRVKGGPCPTKDLNRIQQNQNYAARLVLRLHKFSHITPALATLHWLLVNHRIDFNIALLIYKALNGQTPAYIADLLHPRSCARQTSNCVRFAVQPQFYGTISLKVKRLPRLLIILKWN